jgi:hypothetical protein
MVVGEGRPRAVPILPIVDLLILLAVNSFLVGGLLKLTTLFTRYKPTLAGLSSLDFLAIGLALLMLAIALVARGWLRVNEASASRADAARRAAATLDQYALAHADAAQNQRDLDPANQPLPIEQRRAAE